MSILSITDFLHNIEKSKQAVDQTSVVCFIGDEYPLLFFSWVLPYFKKADVQLVSLDLKDGHSTQIKAQLATSFLGQKSIYWLRNLGDLSAKEQRAWIGFLSEYQGPNTLLFFTSQILVSDKNSWHCVSLASQVDALLLTELFSFFTTVSPHNIKTFVKKVLMRYKKISIDQACLLVQYVQLSGQDINQLCAELLDMLLVSDASLFALSTAFFAKNGSEFFTLWAHVGSTYSPQFWVSFWSEQLWRAHWFVHLMKTGQRLDAKKMSYRLPFSFMQKDWRFHDSAGLKRAHAHIYAIDYQLKNGGNAFALDTFYAEFFI